MPIYLWLILAAILLIVEIFTAGFFIACFAIGALFAGIAAWLFTISFFWQCLIFVAISSILIPVAKSLGKRMAKDNVRQAGVDALIGEVALVTEDIDPDAQQGQIKIEGESWRAYADDAIKTGEKVRLLKVKGAMIKVEKIEGSN